MKTSLAQRWFTGVGALMAVLYLALGVSISGAGFWDDDSTSGIWAVAGFLPAALIVAGLWARSRAPLIGNILVLAGAAPVAAMMWWTVLGPVLALLMILLFIRTLRTGRTERQLP